MRTWKLIRAGLLSASAVSIVTALPALAQDITAAPENDQPTNNDIIVTAQRVEQRLQDVPISITVLDTSDIQNNNITSAKDLAVYTPGLAVNTRFGSDTTTWTIRGFTQEQRTTATVGTYFADVVAPRGSGQTQGGDGAGPGSLFDLQNVQILKGPQGTLFGRNSTGGAVILTPRKPTDRLEGYLEGSVGDYGMYRVQAVANIPLADTFRVRLGLDRLKRDGYLQNAGRIGFGPFGDAGGSVDYWATRLSVVGELTPTLENYTIFSYSRSKSTGVVPKITQCFLNSPYAPFSSTGAFGAGACAQKAREDATGNFWTVSNGMPNHGSQTEQWQVINTTKWEASDTLTVKNIFSYGEFRGNTNVDLFGLNIPYRVNFANVTNPGQLLVYSESQDDPVYGNSNAQASMVEELQLQYKSSDGRLTAQGGVYFEFNDPLGVSGSQAPQLGVCLDAPSFNCVSSPQPVDPISGITLSYNITRSSSQNWLRDKAVYAQASYDITDQLKVTAGFRYTWDSYRSRFALQNLVVQNVVVPFTGSQVTGTCTNTLTFGAAGTLANPSPVGSNNPLFNAADRFGRCWEEKSISTSAPTWLLDIDYKPTDDILLYAKWSRGYRQGGVNAYGGDKLQLFGAEKVDTYEIGAKTSWRGPMPGYFNISAFYNNFRNQQLQIGALCSLPATQAGLCSGSTTTILNVGKSRLYGLELEAGITPFEGLRLEVSYAYLNTKVQEIADIIGIFKTVGLGYDDIRPVPLNEVIPYSMPHKLTASAYYTLPLDRSMGKITFGGTYVYQAAMRVTTDPFVPSTTTTPVPVSQLRYASEYGIVPASNLFNLNVTWEGVAGMPVDAAFFMTNVFNEKTYLSANVQPTRGFVSNIIGEPRMFGFRLKYRFGE